MTDTNQSSNPEGPNSPEWADFVNGLEPSVEKFRFDVKTMRWRQRGEDGKLGAFVSAKSVPDSYFFDPNDKSTSWPDGVDEISTDLGADEGEVNDESSLPIQSADVDDLDDVSDRAQGTFEVDAIPGVESEPAPTELHAAVTNLLEFNRKTPILDGLSDAELLVAEDYVVTILNANTGGADILEGLTQEQQDELLTSLRVVVSIVSELSADEVEPLIDSIRQGSPSYGVAPDAEIVDTPEVTSTQTQNANPESSSTEETIAGYRESLHTDTDRFLEIADLNDAGVANDDELEEMKALAGRINHTALTINTLEGRTSEDVSARRQEMEKFLDEIIKTQRTKTLPTINTGTATDATEPPVHQTSSQDSVRNPIWDGDELELVDDDEPINSLPVWPGDATASAGDDAIDDYAAVWGAAEPTWVDDGDVDGSTGTAIVPADVAGTVAATAEPIGREPAVRSRRSRRSAESSAERSPRRLRRIGIAVIGIFAASVGFGLSGSHNNDGLELTDAVATLTVPTTTKAPAPAPELQSSVVETSQPVVTAPEVTASETTAAPTSTDQAPIVGPPAPETTTPVEVAPETTSPDVVTVEEPATPVAPENTAPLPEEPVAEAEAPAVAEAVPTEQVVETPAPEVLENQVEAEPNISDWTWNVAHKLAPGNEDALMNMAIERYNAANSTNFALTPHDGSQWIMDGSRSINPAQMLELNQLMSDLILKYNSILPATE